MKPEPVQAGSRAIPAKIKKFVKKRTNGVCAYQDCTTKIRILHHTERFALKKAHDVNSIEGLCKPHERIVHLGLVENEDQDAKNWRVRKEPNQGSPKYVIDQMVQKYRRFG